jgi:hypothetical protein
MTTKLYDQITAITEEYLGPAAERFITRQITFHLNKAPHELTLEDIPKLAEWAKITLGMLTEDRQVVDDYGKKMKQLGGE